METTIKILCTAQEAFALIDLLPKESFIQLVQNDPTYGLNGSSDFYVVYIDNSSYYFSHSRLFNLGRQVQQKIDNK
jgi:hypothetical protein